MLIVARIVKHKLASGYYRNPVRPGGSDGARRLERLRIEGRLVAPMVVVAGQRKRADQLARDPTGR